MATWTQADVDARCKAWGCEFVRIEDDGCDYRTASHYLTIDSDWCLRDERADKMGTFHTAAKADAALMACEYAPPQHVGAWKAEEIPDDEAEWVLKDGWIWRPTGWHCPDGSFSHRADTTMSLVRAWEQKGQVTRRPRTDRPAPAESKAAFVNVRGENGVATITPPPAPKPREDPRWFDLFKVALGAIIAKTPLRDADSQRAVTHGHSFASLEKFKDCSVGTAIGAAMYADAAYAELTK
jgi:hypothetical protein